MPSLDKIIKRLSCTAMSRARLAADIEDFEVSFARYQVDAARAGKDSSWVDGCNAHLSNAKRALKDCDINSGYQSLLNAERDAVPLMPEGERAARVVSLRHEVKRKLADSWRGESLTQMLDGKPEAVPMEAIREALFHRNTHGQNMYRKIELLRMQLVFIGSLLVVLLLVAILIGACGGLAILDQKTPDNGGLLAFAIYMGVLGGTLSAAISATRIDSSAKIPDVQRTRLITLARSALGGAAAIPVFLLIQGNLVKLIEATFTPWTVLFFCFLAGFSERWFLSTLDTFTKDKSSGDSTAKMKGG